MAKVKQYVFSARTTEEELRLLNKLRKERNTGWDDLVIDAVCAHYGLDRAVMAPPKKDKPAQETQIGKQQARDEATSEAAPTEEKKGERPAKNQKAKGGKKANSPENSLISGKS